MNIDYEEAVETGLWQMAQELKAEMILDDDMEVDDD